MDLPYLLGLLAAVVTIIGFTYGLWQNFKREIYEIFNDYKQEINKHLERIVQKMDASEERLEQKMDAAEVRLERRMDKLNERMDLFEAKTTALEDRMFWVLTGRKLEDVIREDRMKKPRTDP